MEKLRFFGARILRRIRPYRISLIFVGVVVWRFVSPRKAKSNVEDPKNILVVRLDAIGDLTMSSLVFRELKSRFPGSTITAVIQEQNRAILETNPYVDRILSPQRFKKSFFFHNLRQDLSVLRLYRERLQGESIDLAVNPRLDGDLYSADVLLNLVDAPRTFKYKETSKKGIADRLNAFAFRGAVNLPRPPARHEVDNNRAIIESITGVVGTSRPEIFFTEKDLAPTRELFGLFPQDAAILCIAFGAQALRRVWPVERWAEVVGLLSAERQVFVLIACSSSETETARQLQSKLTVPSHILAGATLRQVAASIQSCDLFLGPDSGLAHLAAAVDCPSVIVSPHPTSGNLDHGNSPLRFAPYSDCVEVLQPRHGLAPCVTGCDAIVPHCILQVSPGKVAEAGAYLLGDKGQVASRSETTREPHVRVLSDVGVLVSVPAAK